MRRVASGAFLVSGPCCAPDYAVDRHGGVPVLTAPDATPRRELPTDPSGLEPMGAAFEAALEAGLAELGLLETRAASSVARRAYEAQARLLRDWNRAINLTAIRDPEAMATRHVCDSLSAVPHLGPLVRPGTSLLDLGSGGGYPGLPLATVLPFGRVSLLDSVAKKARFLEVAAAAVTAILTQDDADTVPAIEAINERAEDIAEDEQGREAWDLVVTRAVGSLAEVLELSLPLTRMGGTVVAWKREEAGGLRVELQGAGSVIRAAGGGRPRVVPVEAASLADHRLVMVAKERRTPITYPRPAGVRRHKQR
jgi:16S rRNA (guanine527-N7)-methyltransferase